MSDAGHLITHVSDTARWTALYRATESARADALFSDPLAERLAGEQGRAIVASAPVSSRNGWWLIARTKIIDDAIQAHGGGGVTTDFGLAKAFAGQRTLRIADGPDEVHRRTVARMEFGKYGDLVYQQKGEREAALHVPGIR